MLVTGATGFIGTHVTLALLRAGMRVRALLRGGRPVPMGCEPVLLDEAGRIPPQALADVHAVVHLAGRAHALKRDSHALELDMQRDNVALTRTVADAATAAGVHRFVLLSSVAAGFPQGADAASSYDRSKLAAEREALAASRRSQLTTVILRAPVVYGAGMKGNPLTLFDWLAAERPVAVGRGVRRNVLYVGNLADAVVRSVLSGPPGNFVVSDATIPTVADFITMAASGLGRRARMMLLPAPAIRGAAACVGIVSARAQRLLLRTSEPLELDATAFTKAYGYRPSFAVEDGLEATAQWYLQQHGA